MTKRSRDEQVTNPDLKGWKHYFPSPSGPLDIDKLDLPNDFAPLEWWYFNVHVEGKKTGNVYSLFSSFFRQADLASRSKADTEAKKPFKSFQTACTWSISDVSNERYYPDSLLDTSACDHLVKKLDPKYTGRRPVHAEGPLLEMAKEGRLPRPDRPMKKSGYVSHTTLKLSFDEECTLERIEAPSSTAGVPSYVYKVALSNPNKKVYANFTLTPTTAPVRHGGAGVVNEMFYYYIPRATVEGHIKIGAHEEDISGQGWYDRELGGSEDSTGADALDAWTWFSLQLTNDSEFTFFNVVDRDKHVEKECVGVYTKRDGTRITCRDCTLQYAEMWTSLNTYIEYPMMWQLTAPSIGLDLSLSCAFKAQEFLTILVSGGGFYEGRVTVQGSAEGKHTTGTGFLERKNHTSYNDTAGLLKNVGRFVKKTLSEMYPLDGSSEYINKVVLGRHCTGKGAPPKLVCETLFRPVRSLIDRGGKSWRSLVLVSSINALAPEHMDCTKYIAISELLHVGSLIIDDIQDESLVRRGEKCVHLEYGVPVAINAGTGCYFMAPTLAGIEELPPERAFKLYNLYFDVLRAGHAGQGLDINGLDYLMPSVVETGDTQPLYDALQAIHVYKTGGAAGTLCEMACVLCGTNETVQAAMGNFGTQLGLAFQIVDDALNLRGFEGHLKEVGEDIRDGKVTYPVIKAMSRLSLVDRKYIYGILLEHTEDDGKVSSVIAKLNSVGAIDDCLTEAHNFVEDAWKRLDPLIEDSLPKMMMRAFCNYLTERTF